MFKTTETYVLDTFNSLLLFRNGTASVLQYIYTPMDLCVCVCAHTLYLSIDVILKHFSWIQIIYMAQQTTFFKDKCSDWHMERLLMKAHFIYGGFAVHAKHWWRLIFWW